MKLHEMMDFIKSRQYEVKSSYDGKLIFSNLRGKNKIEKHLNCEVSSIWSEIKLIKGTFGNNAVSIIAMYITDYDVRMGENE